MSRVVPSSAPAAGSSRRTGAEKRTTYVFDSSLPVVSGRSANGSLLAQGGAS